MLEVALYDLGCRFPECTCKVPDWAFSQNVRKSYCTVFIRTLSPNKGKDMNEHTDPAFAPVDEAPRKDFGPQSDGTVAYQIVEGDTFEDGKLVKKDPEVVGYVQLENQPEVQ